MVKILNEDKVVKFGGKTYPKDGWCMILAGGPGSGKSTARKNLIPIEGKIFDADELSMFLHKHFKPQTNYQKKYGGKFKDIDPRDDGFTDDEMTMDNSKYVSYLHNKRKSTGLKDIKWNSMFTDAKNDGKLVNIIFDTTGDDQSKIDNIVRMAKSVGYKTSLVYIFTDIDTQLRNNRSRERVMDDDLVKMITLDVYDTLLNMYNNTSIPGNTLSLIDEIWAIVSIDADLKSRQGKLDYIKAQNVFPLKLNGREMNLDVGDIYDWVNSQINKIDPDGNSLEESYYLYKAFTE
jgi:predicted kinase